MNRHRPERVFALGILFAALAASSTDAQIESDTVQPPVVTRAIPVPPPQPVPTAPTVDSILKWDAETKEVTVLHGITKANFAFWLTNVSDQAIVIDGVRTSCGCTAAQLPQQPWTIPPGTNGEIQVTMDVANKTGLLTKTVTITTDKGAKMLFVKANVMPPPAGEMAEAERARNQQLALADRQAVFRGDCASCHAVTGTKLGKELYVSVCGVCHEAEHRAAMVPNLHNLTQPTNAEYWRNWITKGKPGTLMPAFSDKEAGILNDAQIESIVKYLTETIPSHVSTNQPAAAPATPAPGKSLSQR